MRSLGFEPVQGSGSGWVHKEDGENDAALAQLKSTESDSYRVSTGDLDKLEYHASVSNKVPVFVIEFLGRETYAMINVKDFYRLQDLVVGKKVETEPRGNFVCSSEVEVGRKKVASAAYDKRKYYEEEEARWNKKNK